MISLGKIVSAHHTFTDTKLNTGDDYAAIESVYEMGMVEVLKELAVTKMMEWEKKKNRSEEIDQAIKTASNTYNRLRDTLATDEQHDLLMELESNYNFIAMLETDQHFIAGFLEGYRFAKGLKESYKGNLN